VPRQGKPDAVAGIGLDAAAVAIGGISLIVGRGSIAAAMLQDGDLRLRPFRC
jgi:ribose/xylose/arabinose/galactoside ABC-type transport system permease subunit